MEDWVAQIYRDILIYKVLPRYVYLNHSFTAQEAIDLLIIPREDRKCHIGLGRHIDISSAAIILMV